MKKHGFLLKDSLSLLRQIRQELHDDIDSSKRIELDRIISQLENCDRELTQNQMLIVFGKVLSSIAMIERLLKLLS